MAKLVKAKDWCARYFEPGSEPSEQALLDWISSDGKGVLIGSDIYIWDNALFSDCVTPAPRKMTGTDLLRN